ncbi:DUF349 domain-containing protein [Roseateles oligotrophus]|uniref:DUF349 domain-containing protein n=1 Tax=Roseateles oligotrophus TaxID=1769250 RepID=A0ABT2YII8_9BURK|nr:DUF349 domain-containing protein [Roseateles oligotrophus]MCV2369818.1 DUF349 domain-containing protein [Roseateles oligotrophus]
MRVQQHTPKLTGGYRRDHMLSWIFKKFGRKSADATATPSAAKSKGKQTANAQAQAAQAERAVEQKAAQKSQKLEAVKAAKADWAPRLQAAMGDDAALLTLAQTAPLLDIKLAAVEALTGEAALKQAEREFRSHDRRVHRVAKTRLEAAVARREARAQAQTLIASATALSAEPHLAINVLVSLDRDWQALDPELLEPAQIEQFRGLSGALNSNLRQRSELEQALQRWTADATQSLNTWAEAAEQAAAAGLKDDLSAQAQGLQQLQQRCPDLSAAAGSAAHIALVGNVGEALQALQQTEARLTWLAALDSADAAPAAETKLDVDPEAGSPEATAPTAPSTPSIKQQWQLMEPVADASLSRLLNQRFEQWLRAHAPAQLDDQPAAQTEASPKPKRSAEARNKRPSLSSASPEQTAQFQTILEQAEADQAAGLLSDMQQKLLQIDDLLQGVDPASLAEALRERHLPLLAERNRLRDWEQWGGARALDALVAEAESLAEATAAAQAAAAPAEAQPNVAAEPADDTVAEATADGEAVAPSAPVKPAKLNLKAQREAIQALRKRWKEVDRLSAGAGQALWQRFDAALQIANQPVAAQLAELKIAREANLASRELLLDQLDALPEASADAAGEAASAQWKECLRALSAFQLAWRQLGPVEHTVPMANREALLQRQRASLDRIELPLQQARRAAEAQRELLIKRAEALLQELQQNPQLRDVTQRVRDLQAEWQEQARSLALARPTENDLWSRFKAATDAVFAQRSAAFDAREEAQASSLAEYEASLQRLIALTVETPDAEIRRTLAEVDRAWRQGAELPRAVANALDARLQAAHAAAMQILDGRGQLIWQAQCEALSAKLRLCESKEGQQPDGSDGADELDFATRWAALPALPAGWDLALTQRAPAKVDLDDLLLQLEAALDMPASEAMQAARRLLKLKTMKDVLEGRASSQQGALQQAAWLSTGLRANNCTPAQAQRLHAVIAALSKAPAGTFGA